MLYRAIGKEDWDKLVNEKFTNHFTCFTIVILAILIVKLNFHLV